MANLRKADHSVMSFGEHLEDLRRRVIFALAGVVPIFVLSLLVGKSLLAFLLVPVQDALLAANLPAKLQITGVMEAFSAYVRVSVILTVLVGAPWMLWQLWMFVAPGLYPNERRFAYLLTPLSMVLTVMGVTFMYRIMLPVVLMFFINFGMGLSGPAPAQPRADLPPGVVLPTIPLLDADPPEAPLGSMWVNGPLKELRIITRGEDGVPLVLTSPLVGTSAVVQQYRVSEYVSMLLGFAMAFAVAFQMPVVVLLLGWAGVVQPALLRKHRKHAIMVCAVLGALLTPTDPLSMLLMGGPLYLLYEVGLLLLSLLPAERVAAGFDFFSKRKAAAGVGGAAGGAGGVIDADAGDGGGP